MFSNRRKISIILVLLFISCLLTSCTSQRTRDEILEKLRKENIIKENWELLYLDVIDASPIPAIIGYDYIFIDKSNSIDKDENFDEQIRLVSIKKKDSNNYDITISENVLIKEENKEFLDEENNLKNKTIYHVYKHNDDKKYLFKFKNFILFKTTQLSEVN